MARLTRFLKELKEMVALDREGAIDDMLAVLRQERVIDTVYTMQMVDALALGRFGEDVVMPSYRDRAVMLTATRLKEANLIVEIPLEKHAYEDQFGSQFQSAVSLEYRTSVDVIRRKPYRDAL